MKEGNYEETKDEKEEEELNNLTAAVEAGVHRCAKVKHNKDTWWTDEERRVRNIMRAGGRERKNCDHDRMSTSP